MKCKYHHGDNRELDVVEMMQREEEEFFSVKPHGLVKGSGDWIRFPSDPVAKPSDIEAEKRREEKRREKRQRAKVQIARRDALHLSVYAVRYCTTCGVRIIRTDETPAVWCKIRRCDKCVENNRQATPERKFCSSCGKNMADESGPCADWGTKATCSVCADLNKVKSRTVKTLT